MDAGLFLADLEEKPARLAALAQHLRNADPWAALGEIEAPVVVVGMGSSHYAGQVAAARLRAGGVPAVAELAASDLLPALRPGTLVVAVSASGGSAETIDAVRRLRAAGDGLRFAALTNRPDTELGDLCDATVDLAAGEERGGVACRSFQHTVALLLALESDFCGGPAVVTLLEQAAEASAHLLAHRADWLAEGSSPPPRPHGTPRGAPAPRIHPALPPAPQLRAGPRA